MFGEIIGHPTNLPIPTMPQRRISENTQKCTNLRQICSEYHKNSLSASAWSRAFHRTHSRVLEIKTDFRRDIFVPFFRPYMGHYMMHWARCTVRDQGFWPKKGVMDSLSFREHRLMPGLCFHRPALVWGPQDKKLYCSGVLLVLFCVLGLMHCGSGYKSNRYIRFWFQRISYFERGDKIGL